MNKKYIIHNFSKAEHDADIRNVIGRKSQYMDLKFSDTVNADYIFWRDRDFKLTYGDTNKNFSWLTESRAIDPATYSEFESNIDDIAKNFKYVFTHDRSLVEKNDKIKWIPANFTWIVKPKVYQHKVNLISMITSSKSYCEGHRKRLDTVNSLKGKIDLYGRGFNRIDFKEEGLAQYMFSVAHENASYSGYFTEKVLDCFATGTIPIYWGDPDIGKVFNTDGIIMLDDFNLSDLNAELYYSKMEAVKENCQIVKDNFMLVEDYIYKNYLKDDNDNL